MEQQQKPGTAGHGIDIGAVLREARERAGMSVEEVAGRIKFAPRQIAALESGDFSKLPELAFIRGFVRSYARLLELDDKALLDALPGAPAPVAVQARYTGGEVPGRGAERRKQNLFWIGGAVVLVAVVIVAWKYDAGDALPRDVQATHPGAAAVPGNPASGEVAASAPAAAAPATGDQPPEVTAPAEAAAPAAPAAASRGARATEKTHAIEKNKAARKTQPATAMSGASRPAPEPGSTSLMQAAPVMAPHAASAVGASSQPALHPVSASRPLRFEFEEDSWVEVKDGTGHVLLSMMGKQGSTRSVSGPPPLSVVVGNAGGVKLYYEGEPVALKPIAGTEVARLKLE